MKYIAAYLIAQSGVGMFAALYGTFTGKPGFECMALHFLSVIMLGVGVLVGKKAMEQPK